MKICPNYQVLLPSFEDLKKIREEFLLRSPLRQLLFFSSAPIKYSAKSVSILWAATMTLDAPPAPATRAIRKLSA